MSEGKFLVAKKYAGSRASLPEVAPDAGNFRGPRREMPRSMEETSAFQDDPEARPSVFPQGNERTIQISGTSAAIIFFMSENGKTNSRVPNACQSLGLGIVGLLLGAGVLTGCSVLRDYSGDTCDGQKPAGSLEQAAKDLVASAYAADLGGACRVTAPLPRGVLDDSMVAKTREILADRGITPQNVTVVIGEQMGSGVEVSLTDGSANASNAIKVGGHVVRDDGFMVGLPPELYPDVPEHPASQSASAEPVS